MCTFSLSNSASSLYFAFRQSYRNTACAHFTASEIDKLSAGTTESGGAVTLTPAVVSERLEAYVLNPKFMSNKTELPVCFVFIILLVSEHYLGVWGLLIGVPLFIFLMNALDVNFQEEKKKTKYNTKNGK